jgi:hypothetical protein
MLEEAGNVSLVQSGYLFVARLTRLHNIGYHMHLGVRTRTGQGRPRVGGFEDVFNVRRGCRRSSGEWGHPFPGDVG